MTVLCVFAGRRMCLPDGRGAGCGLAESRAALRVSGTRSDFGCKVSGKRFQVQGLGYSISGMCLPDGRGAGCGLAESRGAPAGQGPRRCCTSTRYPCPEIRDAF